MYKKIKVLCAKRGWKMSDVANELNISESYLYKLIAGDRCNTKQIKKMTDLVYANQSSLSTLKSKVKTACRERDMSMEDLAKEIEVSVPYLYDVLNGRKEGKRVKKKLKIFLD